MTTNRNYRIDVAGEPVGYVVATSPTKALRDWFGDALASQDGRYGRLQDGRSCVALTMSWSRRRVDPNERTTRLS